MINIAEEINKKNNNCINNINLFVILLVEQFLSKNKKIKGGGRLKRIIIENSKYI